MYTTAEDVYGYLHSKIIDDTQVIRNTVPGLCRPWTGAVLDVIEREKQNCDTSILLPEAREVEVELGLWHTFVRLLITLGSETVEYILNGVEAHGMPVYYGRASTAPAKLLNSSSDPINFYRAATNAAGIRTDRERRIIEGFSVKTDQELILFLIGLERNNLKLGDLPPGNWEGIFVSESPDGPVFACQPNLVRLALLILLQVNSLTKEV